MTYQNLDANNDGVVDVPVNNDSVRTGRLFNTKSDAAVQARQDGLVVPVGDGLSMSDAIDPANTSNAMADVMDLFRAESTFGVVYLPGSVQIDGQFDPANGVSVVGTSQAHSRIIQQSTTADTAVWGTNGTVVGATYHNIEFRGPGDDVAGGVPLVFNESGGGTSIKECHFGNIKITDVANKAMENRAGSAFDVTADNLRIGRVDAGNVEALIDLFPGAECPGWDIQHLGLYPTATTSGANSRGIRTGVAGDHITVSTLQADNALGEVYYNEGRGGCKFGHVNYVSNQPGGTPSWLFSFLRDNSERVEQLRIGGAGAGTVYDLRLDNAGKYLAKPEEVVSVTGPIVDVRSDPTGPSIFEGVSADVANNTGATLSNPISCLGDLTTKTSTN